MSEEIVISPEELINFITNDLPENDCVEPIFKDHNIGIRKAELSSFEDRFNAIVWNLSLIHI